MTIIWLAVAALACTGVGYAMGYAFGHEDGARAVYRKLDEFHEGRTRR